MSGVHGMELLWNDEDASCPCRRPVRWLEETDDDTEDDPVLLWEIIYTCVVLFLMFVALISDRFGADSIMLTALTAFMAASIISVPEGLDGFANEGLMTVLTLFVVADGISKTGALDWYMGKLLGRPTSAASAQLKLMIPIAIVSAFLNNTPVVAVMIPIVQRWSRNIGISVQQLLIPLSFASILGGTCTLIGTSTNLVVAELLVKRYPNDPSINIGLFDLGLYGVPVALAGICYILLASPWLLPGGSGKRRGGSTIPLDNQEDILLGARLAPWSPAAGRSVKRSGLRDTGGIYLVSVHRAATGNVHRAVGQEFVLNVGDVLYFTGLVEGFGEFCEEHGMEVLTSDLAHQTNNRKANKRNLEEASNDERKTERLGSSTLLHHDTALSGSNQLLPVVEGESESEDVPIEVGVTAQSLMQADEAERSRSIARMIDTIRGVERDEPTEGEQLSIMRGKKGARRSDLAGPHKVVVTSENDLVVIGVDANDRPGLLLDISKGLLRLNLSFRHTEASALLENDGNQAAKQRGMRVIRAVVTKTSSLIGKTAAEVDFRKMYKAAIIAVQKGGRNVSVANVVFGFGDIVVLQADEASPLLRHPPADFYKHLTATNKDVGTRSRSNSVSSLVNMMTKTITHSSNTPVLQKGKVQSGDLESSATGDNIVPARESDSDDEMFFIGDEQVEDTKEGAVHGGVSTEDMQESLDNIDTDDKVWRDLQVLFAGGETNSDDNVNAREFLAAMAVAPKSGLAGRSVQEIGLDKQTGVFLVSIDRPNDRADNGRSQVMVRTHGAADPLSENEEASMSLRSLEPTMSAISTQTPLMEGDILWFAGSASALGDLRKIPGLLSYESGEVAKMNEKIHDRRLVEAVVARRGPLVGKTVKSIRFRTKYGAAVIAVHREGNRVLEHPGKIKLQGGDVLLLEAGPTFIKKSVDNDRSFALLAEVKDSAPPRLRLLIPALILTVAMLAVYTADIGVSLFVCALVASILMVTVGILSEQEARDAVNWEVYITIASAFGIGNALVNSGVAGGVANFLVDVGNAVGIGDAGLLGAVYLATFLISNVVTNNAAAALLFPIALEAGDQTGVDKTIMSYCLMLGASASFMSPFGYT
eukprot:scaffold25049_cov127-Cylindrotheca_fusiformis.AAC.2